MCCLPIASAWLMMITATVPGLRVSVYRDQRDNVQDQEVQGTSGKIRFRRHCLYLVLLHIKPTTGRRSRYSSARWADEKDSEPFRHRRLHALFMRAGSDP